MARKANELPPIDILRRYFRVDEHSRLQRRTATKGWQLTSKIRGKGKYFTVCFEGKNFFAHRIIWALHHGRDAAGVIDHINGMPWDNRIENLREATPAQNRWNARSSQPNATGHANVEATRGGFRARVCANYQHYTSPVFDDPELAGLAANEMQHRLHGEFAYINREAA